MISVGIDVAVPCKLQKAVALQQLAVLLAAQYALNVSRQFQICRTICYKLFWQRIGHPQPGSYWNPSYIFTFCLLSADNLRELILINKT